jgi:hypothetical protein
MNVDIGNEAAQLTFLGIQISDLVCSVYLELYVEVSSYIHICGFVAVSVSMIR